MTYVGILQRHCPEKFYLVEAPITKSQDRARVPKLQHAVWSGIMNEAFRSDDNLVLMTDMASCYVEVEHPA
eukprot:7734459-Alexandrium_andersonii.AAC.1